MLAVVDFPCHLVMSMSLLQVTLPGLWIWSLAKQRKRVVSCRKMSGSSLPLPVIWFRPLLSGVALWSGPQLSGQILQLYPKNREIQYCQVRPKCLKARQAVGKALLYGADWCYRRQSQVFASCSSKGGCSSIRSCCPRWKNIIWCCLGSFARQIPWSRRLLRLHCSWVHRNVHHRVGLLRTSLGKTWIPEGTIVLLTWRCAADEAVHHARSFCCIKCTLELFKPPT